MAKNAKIFFTIRIYLSLQNPKNAKDGAESMFGPSWIHEKAEKTDGPVYEEIFCKVFQKLCYVCWRHQYLYFLENECNFKKLRVTTKIA